MNLLIKKMKKKSWGEGSRVRAAAMFESPAVYIVREIHESHDSVGICRNNKSSFNKALIKIYSFNKYLAWKGWLWIPCYVLYSRSKLKYRTRAATFVCVSALQRSRDLNRAKASSGMLRKCAQLGPSSAIGSSSWRASLSIMALQANRQREFANNFLKFFFVPTLNIAARKIREIIFQDTPPCL